MPKVLKIDSADCHAVIDSLEVDIPSNYKEWAGPYIGIVPFSSVFASVTVSGEKVASIVSSYASKPSHPGGEI